MECTFQGPNTASLTNRFTINGPFIQNDADTTIKGTINDDDGSITWNKGATFYAPWTRNICPIDYYDYSF